MKEISLSGIRATGHLHLGNYFGALRNFIAMQNEYQCYFFIADLHALTTHPHSAEFAENVQWALAEYIAAGLDPAKSVLFVQSDVPEISEMYVLLNMLAYVGELERTVSFKEKVRRQPNNVNAGLLTYPVLMAADILIHRAVKVPVGKDQEQHLESTRIFARRFNNMYSTAFFPEPSACSFTSELVKIPGLDGSGKMGKSEGNALYLSDDETAIRNKVKRAVTDVGDKTDTMSEPVKNLFTILKAVSDTDVVNFYEQAYCNGTIRYSDLKNQLANDICKLTLPIRTRTLEILKDVDFILRVRKNGAEQARESASKTLHEMKKIMGFWNAVIS